MNILVRLLEQYGYISPLCRESLYTYSKVIKKQKGELLVKQGGSTPYFYILASGFVAGVYLHKNTAYDMWYCKDAGLVLSTYPRYKGKELKESIVCLEDSQFFAIPSEVLMQLIGKFPELNLLFRRAMEEYSVQLQDRMYAYLYTDPFQRFYDLKRSLNGGIDRLSDERIASYLRISVAEVGQLKKR